MPIKPLVSKIRCNNPNKVKSAAGNQKHLLYIGTREGVDLTPSPASDDTYLNYIANRPKSHGLFGNIECNNIDSLAKNIHTLTRDGKCIYRGIVSLSSEDAINLGYDHKQNWEDYMRSVMPNIANEFKIPITDLCWTAAVHMEERHPHCHFMMWSTSDKVRSPYIHTSVQNRCREIFSGKMFEAERHQELISKTIQRDLLTDLGYDLNNSILSHMRGNVISGKFKETDLQTLSKDLLEIFNTLPGTGRYSYKLLPPKDKVNIDELVNKIVTIPPVRTIYNDYLKTVNDIINTYSPGQEYAIMKMNDAKSDIHKRLANQLLKTCKEMKSEIDIIVKNISAADFSSDMNEDSPDLNMEVSSVENGNYKIEWNKTFKTALTYIFAEIPDYEKAIPLLHKEMKSGNVLATEQLAKLYKYGLGVEKNQDLSSIYYSNALNGLKNIYDNCTDSKLISYLSYKLGKYYEKGTGTDIDYMKAHDYYLTSADDGNKYAQYSLANIYLRDKIDSLSIQMSNNEMKHEGIRFLKMSADNRFGYAANSYAKIMKNTISEDILQDYYKIAFSYFKDIESKNPTDDIYYTLGTMYYSGNGTDMNKETAYQYFVRSAEHENINAYYALGKTYADRESIHYDPDKAFEYYSHIASDQKQYVYVAISDLYLNPDFSQYDPNKAIELLNKESLRNDGSALTKLGNIYLWGQYENVHDTSLGTKLLMQASAIGNEYAKKSLDAYENYRSSMVQNHAYSLLHRVCDVIAKDDQRNRFENQFTSERAFRSKSKEALKEQRKKEGKSEKENEES